MRDRAEISDMTAMASVNSPTTCDALLRTNFIQRKPRVKAEYLTQYDQLQSGEELKVKFVLEFPLNPGMTQVAELPRSPPTPGPSSRNRVRTRARTNTTMTPLHL